MAKPKKERVILEPPSVAFYKPRGIPMAQLERVVLELDEYEAIRLVDKDGLQQDQAAQRMGVSRATCARILESAHRKIGEALTGGKAIEISGGSYVLQHNRYRCTDCGTLWQVPIRNAHAISSVCPACKSRHVTDLGEQFGRGLGRGRRRGGRQARGTGDL